MPVKCDSLHRQPHQAATQLAVHQKGFSGKPVSISDMNMTGMLPQVGAAVAALACEPTLGAAPLVFCATKVALGHTEPAAGAAGICSAMLR